MNGAQLLIRHLEEQGITTLAGIPGGSILPVYRALADSSIRHILARHEQAAGFIAAGMARASGRPAVCMATSGPGVTNLLTALADSYADSVPIIAITGQVPQALLGKESFQEVDTCALAATITKKAWLVHHPDELNEIIPQAFRLAQSGRPGPVLIDIPRDVQLMAAEYKPAVLPAQTEAAPDLGALRTAARWLAEAERPLIYAGGGANSSEASAALTGFARRNKIPVVMTLMGLGAFPADDPLSLGLCGMHGSRAANRMKTRADLIIAAGARFGDRATGRTDAYGRGARIIHIDIEPAQFGRTIKAHLELNGHAAQIFKAWDGCGSDQAPDRSEWLSELRLEKAAHGYPHQALPHPHALIRKTTELAGPDVIALTDVGQHQMWAAQAFPAMRPRGFITSGGLGTMGFGLPAAMGAAIAGGGRRALLFTGDGSLQMNLQELATLREQNLPVTIILLDNNHLGLVRQQQEWFYDNRRLACRFEANPDFSELARLYGIPAWKTEADGGFEDALRGAFSEKGPSFVHCRIEPELHVTPMVPPGAALAEMRGE